MRWGLLGVRLGILVVNLAITAIIVLSFLPLMQNGLDFNMPDSGMTPSFEDGVISVSMPIEVYNGGFYNIDDFSINYKIKDGLLTLYEDESLPVDIVAGRTTTVNIALSIDLDRMGEEALRRMIFESSDLDIIFGMEAYYTMGLVRFELSGSQEMHNDAFISNINIDRSNIQVDQIGSSYNIIIPYQFNAAGMIQGQQVNLDASLVNSTSTVASGSEDLTLSSFNQGQIVLTMPEEVANHYRTHDDTFFFTMELFGATMTLDDLPIDWTAPEGSP